MGKLQNDGTDNRDQDKYAHKHEYPVFPCFTIDVQLAGCHLNLPNFFDKRRCEKCIEPDQDRITC